MHLSDKGLELLKQLEGCSPVPYKDVADLWTTGVGHLLTKSERSSGKLIIDGVPVRYARGLTAAWIDALLRQDLRPVETVLQTLALPFTPGQYDALCCFIFNVGTQAFVHSTLRKRLEAGDAAAVPAQLRRWVYAGGQVIPGLRRRREREIARWLAADEPAA